MKTIREIYQSLGMKINKAFNKGCTSMPPKANAQSQRTAARAYIQPFDEIIKMANQEFIQNIRNLIAKDELSKAMDGLKVFLEYTPLFDEILNQSGRFENIRRHIRLGTVSHAEATLTQNQIRVALLELLSEIETQNQTPALRHEFERAISIVQSKNVVMGSNISTGVDMRWGDNIIGDQTNIQNQYITYYDKRNVPTCITSRGADVPNSFVGRTDEKAKIRALLTTRKQPLALVNAEGGMGKTTLAAYYWQEFARDYQHMAWIFCERGIVSAMLNELPKPLGILEDMTTALKQAAATQTPNEDALWPILKNEMARLNKPCLLVLDNANDPAEIRLFLQKAKGLDWHILLTSRCAKVMTDADSEYTIAGLPPDLAKKLFKSNHVEATPDFEPLLDRFLAAVGYNTLCIEVFSKNLAEGRDWGQTLRRLLDKLETTGLILREGSFEVRADWTGNTQRPNTRTTDDIITALYNLADIKQTEPLLHALLSTVALLPAEKHPATTLRVLLSAENPEILKNHLDQLVRKGWLSQAENAYRISPVVQKIVLQDTSPEQRWQWAEPMVQRLFDVFEHDISYPKNVATASQFADLILGLVDNIGIANDDIATLFRRLWGYHNAIGNIQQAIISAEKRRNISMQYDNKSQLVGSYDLLGRTYRALGNLPKALDFFEESIRLAEELHEANPQQVDFKYNLATIYDQLGRTYQTIGNLPKALELFEAYNQLAKEVLEADPQNVDFKGLIVSYYQLGATYAALGNLPRALEFGKAYNRFAEELHKANPQQMYFKSCLATSYDQLGTTYRALGNLQKALEFFDAYNQLSKELHEASPQQVDFKNNLAVSYYQLGTTYSALGNLQKALEFCEASNQLSKELHEANPQNMDINSNYAESSSMLFAMNKLTNQTTSNANIDNAIGHFEMLFSSMQTPHYQKKVTLCQQIKMADNEDELKRLIEEISAF
jgi:tetratricopeptide (TPR) repeat protein